MAKIEGCVSYIYNDATVDDVITLEDIDVFSTHHNEKEDHSEIRNTSYLESLPSELLHEVLDQLSLRDLRNMRANNNFFANYIPDYLQTSMPHFTPVMIDRVRETVYQFTRESKVLYFKIFGKYLISYTSANILTCTDILRNAPVWQLSVILVSEILHYDRTIYFVLQSEEMQKSIVQFDLATGENYAILSSYQSGLSQFYACSITSNNLSLLLHTGELYDFDVAGKKINYLKLSLPNGSRPKLMGNSGNLCLLFEDMFTIINRSKQSLISFPLPNHYSAYCLNDHYLIFVIHYANINATQLVRVALDDSNKTISRNIATNGKPVYAIAMQNQFVYFSAEDGGVDRYCFATNKQNTLFGIERAGERELSLYGNYLVSKTTDKKGRNEIIIFDTQKNYKLCKLDLVNANIISPCRDEVVVSTSNHVSSFSLPGNIRQ